MRFTAIKKLIGRQSQQWHRRRFEIFVAIVQQASPPVRSLLDLGGGSGGYVADHVSQLPGIEITVADIGDDDLRLAVSRHGFKAVKLPESGPLPFPDGAFDFVFCNSAIEHVTGPKEGVWRADDHQLFRSSARRHQAEFAAEIARVGRGYFVQTPHPGFPLEPHTWLPFAHYLPRPLLIRLLCISNRWWIKRTNPDWLLLGGRDMRAIFPDATLVVEKTIGIPRSLIAYRIA